MKRNNSKEYGDWIGKMGWRYMITIRKNYKTNSTVVRNTATKLIKGIDSCERAVYVGERDSVDYNNYHIHILINMAWASGARAVLPVANVMDTMSNLQGGTKSLQT